jgi:DNA repair exonuclease SbcCD ATPase subunit
MKVSRINVTNFMVRGSAAIELPANGVVVIVGENGAGKSRFIEAVSYAFWGRTLRGKTPWLTGLVGEVSVALRDDFIVRRAVTASGKVILTANGQKADTNTKTQESLDAQFSDHELWRRTHVFSSSDALHFSDATDSGRKDMLESLLGLTVFDQAAETCKQEIAQAQTAVTTATNTHTAASAKLEKQQAVFDTWEPLPPFDREPRPVWMGGDAPAQAEDAAKRIAEYKAELLARIEPVRDTQYDAAYDEARQRVNAAEDHHRLVLRGECPTCGQKFPTSIQQATAHLEYAQDECTRLGAQFNGTVTAHAQARCDWVRARDILHGAIADWQVYAGAYEAYKRQRAAHAAVVEAYEKRDALRKNVHEKRVTEHYARRTEMILECDAMKGGLMVATTELAEATRHVQELVEAGRVIKSIRARVLSTTLDGVAAVANAWLARIADPGVSLELKGYSETQAGKLTDKISLEVTGYGGGHGYKAASGGQRRRVDAALLFALAEVASAATGATEGTLWMDEVFDALDDTGQASVAAALTELGQTRTVVVITHSHTLAASINAAARYTVTNGVIQRTK